MKLNKLLIAPIIVLAMSSCDPSTLSTCECASLMITDEGAKIPDDEIESLKKCKEDFNELSKEGQNKLLLKMWDCPDIKRLVERKEKEAQQKKEKRLLRKGHLGRWMNDDDFNKFTYLFYSNGTWSSIQKSGYSNNIYGNGTWSGTAENLTLLSYGIETSTGEINKDGKTLSLYTNIGTITLYKQ